MSIYIVMTSTSLLKEQNRNDFFQLDQEKNTKSVPTRMVQKTGLRQTITLSHNLEGKCHCDKGSVLNCIDDADLERFISDRLDKAITAVLLREEKLKHLLDSHFIDADAITNMRSSLRNAMVIRDELTLDYRDPTRVRSSYRKPSSY